MAVSKAPPAPPPTAAPPSSPVLGAADSGINPQTAAAPIPLSEASSSAYNEAIGVLEPIAPYPVAAESERNLAPTREMNQLPVERPLSAHFMMSSCSEKAYIPTPFNTPQTVVIGRQASSAREGENPTIRRATRVFRSDNLSEKEKVHLRGGGPKKRRGGAASGTRKKSKADKKYEDVDQLLSDMKSPIFQQDADIKAVLAHPQAKQIMVEQGEQYPFDQMTGEELATTAAEFKSDGTYGRFDSQWMSQALEASQTRASGGYDAYLESQFAEKWAEDDKEVSDEEMRDFSDDAKNEEDEKN